MTLPWRRIAGLLAVLACLAGTLSASAEPTPRTKIVPALELAAARSPGDLRFIVQFRHATVGRLQGGAASPVDVLGRRAAALDVQRAAFDLLRRSEPGRGAKSFASLWFVDAVAVRGSAELMNDLAALPEVQTIVPDETFRTSEAPAGPAAAGADWGIARVHAPEAWALGVTGGGSPSASSIPVSSGTTRP